MGDGRFFFNPSYETEKILGKTPKRKTDGFLNNDDLTFNKGLSKNRVIVENINSKLKEFRVLNGIYRHFSNKSKNELDLNKIFFIICCFVNEKIMRKPIR